jgi:hypothetical protein
MPTKANSAKAAAAAKAVGLPPTLQFHRDEVEWDEVYQAFDAVAHERIPQGRNRQKFNRNGPLRRLAAHRAFNRYAAEGGDVGDIQSFMEWLIANWESILKMVMSIISLFS